MRNQEQVRYNFTEVRALVVGLAREGTALTRFLVEHGAQVTATDAKPAAALSDSLDALRDLAVTYALGGHSLELLDEANVVFVSPGVPLEIPLLVEARRRGLPLSTETRLFTQLCPAPVAGITGSSGKTTTTVLAGAMLQAAGHRTWVGGNIGRPLIDHLDEISPQDIVVMELSSFQLDFFGPTVGDWSKVQIGRLLGRVIDPLGWSPRFAALLNITPNHLDRHPNMAAYIAAKVQALAYQHRGDVTVLNMDDPVTRALGQALSRHPGHDKQDLVWFSMEREVEHGAFLHGEELVLQLGDDREIICRADELQLLGRHNVANTLAACALAGAASAAPDRGGAGSNVAALRDTAKSFRGVEHRLELVRERKGARWYNDSIATTPERTVAALRAFPDTSIVLLAGGRDKHLPWAEMAGLAWHRAQHLILFGEAADLIAAAMEANRTGPSTTAIHRAETLAQAVATADQVAQPGDVVLLSPGGTSFDAYPDFAARGAHFRQLVQALE